MLWARLSYLLCWTGIAAALSRPGVEGKCATYGNCGKKSVFGASLPCANATTPVALDQESLQILHRVCGTDFPAENGVCCSHDQLVSLEENLKKANPLVSSCPACRKNFYDFFCKFTCSPEQASFVAVEKTTKAVDTGLEVVSEMTVFTDPFYAEGFYDSCKNIKFLATNGYAMDLIGGGAQNYSQFLKFLGDEKPMLGGSPFQINFNYTLPEHGLDFFLNNGSIKACDDPIYKCACSDCPLSCPSLPAIGDYRSTCKIAGMPCFSFVVAIAWALLFLAIGGYHMILARRRKRQYAHLNSVLDDDDPVLATSSADYTKSNSLSTSKFVTALAGARQTFLTSLNNFFGGLAYFCASNPIKVIVASLAFVCACSLGLLILELETDPTKLWVSEKEPALKNKEYFEAHFGEWYRIEQFIISNKNRTGPVLDWETVQWWFEKELELQELSTPDGGRLVLEDFCFKPMGDYCAIESFTQYFSGQIQYLQEETWQKSLSDCASFPVNCLPPFQQPLKPQLLFSENDVRLSKAFVVTLLLNSNLKDGHYTKLVEAYEKALQLWIQDIQQERPDLQISFSTEISLEEELNKSSRADVKIIVLSYLAMFVYVAIALGTKIPTSFARGNFVSTRILLGFAGVIIIVLAVLSAAGLCSLLRIKSTLIIAEVIPFLVLAVGVDNIFLLLHELKTISSDANESVEDRLSRSLSGIGPSCFTSVVLQALMFLLATIVEMPAVRNFAIYSAGAILVNFLLQMTLFIALLALDEHRILQGRLDFAPWLFAERSIQLGDEGASHIEIDFGMFFRKTFTPFLLKPSNKGKVLAIFLLWLGISLSLLPTIELGLDQRLALPSDSYLVEYFDAIYEHLNIGPPVFFVAKNLDVTERANQQKMCGKFSTCEEFSIANVLEQEYKRGALSTIAEPASSWLDDFFGWLNPDLDQCCRFKKTAIGEEFCSPFAPPRQCVSCYADHSPPYNILMEAFPEDSEFMMYFKQWINEPSDPCPLGGKAPYSTSVDYNKSSIISSYLRTSHKPLRSQADFIGAYENSLRMVDELQGTIPDQATAFAFSPFYVFFVQYVTIVKTTLSTLAVGELIVYALSILLLGLARAAMILTLTTVSILVNIGGVMALWGISLNAVSLVNLVICLGLAVEFTVHLTKAYLTVKNESTNEDAFDDFMGAATETENVEAAVSKSHAQAALAARALNKVGGSVLGGITFTKLIGISVLALAQSQIFEVYYFRMWLALVIIASTHSLVLLPVLLSMFGEV